MQGWGALLLASRCNYASLASTWTGMTPPPFGLPWEPIERTALAADRRSEVPGMAADRQPHYRHVLDIRPGVSARRAVAHAVPRAMQRSSASPTTAEDHTGRGQTCRRGCTDATQRAYMNVVLHGTGCDATVFPPVSAANTRVLVFCSGTASLEKSVLHHLARRNESELEQLSRRFLGSKNTVGGVERHRWMHWHGS